MIWWRIAIKLSSCIGLAGVVLGILNLDWVYLVMGVAFIVYAQYSNSSEKPVLNTGSQLTGMSVDPMQEALYELSLEELDDRLFDL